jgi:hypothetical protein
VTKSTTWNQTAFSFESSTFFYNSTIRAPANVNPGSPGAMGPVKVVHMQDTAEVYFSEVHLYGEDDIGYIANKSSLTSPAGVTISRTL